jgi:AcrR family transcriptional regulator
MTNAESASCGSENKHQLRTKATLRELLDAAEKVFVRDGFEKARLETISAAIGRTKGAVYAHFESKEDLFIALLERKMRVRLQSIQEAIAGRPPQQQRMIARDLFVRAALEEDWPILVLEFKLFALRSAVSKDRVAALYRLLTNDATQILDARDAQQEKEMKLASVVLRGIPSALALERYFDPDPQEDREATKRMLGMCFDSVLLQ